MIEPMLAHRFDKHGAKKVRYPCAVSPKLDGVRAIWHDGVLQSRTGKTWSRHQLPHIFEHLESNVPPGLIVDGELYRHGWPCWRINGAVAVKRLGPSEGTAEVQFHAFDIVGEGTFRDRYDLLMQTDLERVGFLHASSAEEVDVISRAFVRDGYEGAIVRNLDGLYKHGRSFDVLKHKAFQDAEYWVVGVEEGEGQHEGRLGALLLEGGGKCGTGFTVEMREQFWHDPPIGKTVTVRFFEKTADGLPRFPSFAGVRDYE